MIKQIFTLTFFVFSLSTMVGDFAFCDTYSGYDEIVRELTSTKASSDEADSGSDLIRFHAALGMVTSRTQLDLPGHLPQSKTFRGYELALGIDLFSPHWVAEGALRSYDPEKLGAGEISLKEFDLKLIHKISLLEKLVLNLGGGMSARYMDISGPLEGVFPRTNSTPSTIFTTGLNAMITPSMGLGLHLSYRSRLVHDTVDQNSTDGALQFVGIF